MAVRLVITMNAKPGKGGELAKLTAARCVETAKEPGCQQFEVFQSAIDPDKLVLIELWDDDASLAVHAERNRANPPPPSDLRADGPVTREDYVYNRTR